MGKIVVVRFFFCRVDLVFGMHYYLINHYQICLIMQLVPKIVNCKIRI